MINLLLQILDDGRLTDSQGRTVDFKNTIIIMTSNLGSEFLLTNDANKESSVMSLVKQTFKPEFINRIDEIIIFNPLGFKVQMQIVDKLIHELINRLKEKNIELVISESVKKHILDNGYSEIYGARPIKRFIQRFLETFIATSIIEEKIKPNQTYHINLKDNNLIID